ncbi:MAG: hypothetical protein J5802_09565 [Butyrivibrio sp.]|nr:hypothetical protein [Butyrivibrio sp.]
MKLLEEQNRKKLCNILFYIALTIELLVMIYEKSEGVNPGIYGQIFRVTFVLAFGTVLLTEHNKREWIILAAAFVFTLVCWRITGKNELLRFFTFMAAARDIDLKKAMKYVFFVTLAGFGIIALLSAIGVGNLTLTMDYGRDVGEECRYVFGFGNPNDFAACIFALIAMWIWIYGRDAGIVKWIVVLGIDVVIGCLSKSRTSFCLGMFTFLIAIMARYWKKLSECKVIYILTALVTPVFCVAFAVWSAIVSPIPRYEQDHKFYNIIAFIDEALNNRIQYLYRDSDAHEGAIQTWKLFSDRNSNKYFDLGWVRIFYWYGIIPTIIISALVIILIYICYKKKDIWTLILILTLSMYTILEAIFVSEYIGRLYIFPIVGVYLGEFVRRERMEGNV